MCFTAEENYDTYDLDLLATMETLNQWQHFLDGASWKIDIWCDHMNLENFQTSNILSRR
jgi:hypothetical protein